MRTRFVRQRGQTGVTDAIAERRTVITRRGNYDGFAEGERAVADAAADPEIPAEVPRLVRSRGTPGAMRGGPGGEHLLLMPKPVRVGGRIPVALGPSPAAWCVWGEGRCLILGYVTALAPTVLSHFHT